MKTAVADIQVQRSGVKAESTFTIKATGKAFDILSSGLYSDKIKAIVRELSCNAYDSHVAAGKADTPIEVKLPTSLDYTFYVKDFGLGLSPEDIIQIYTTYFESTKTESDDFIGQLGLGSKSPFSYAPTFNVESRFNGMKRMYVCFKNEMGLPAISLMGEEETDEPNGITVSLSVKREDVSKFTDAAKKVFMYFNPMPNVVGVGEFRPFAVKHTIKGNGWKIRETDYYAYMRNAYVVQGFVPYPIDVNQLYEHGLSDTAYKVAKSNLDVYVDIGKVEVAASREALSYDPRTVQNLIEVLEAASREMRTSFQAEFDKCATQWEVAQLLGRLRSSESSEFRDIFVSMHQDEPFQWKGTDIDGKVDLDLSSIQNTTIRTMKTSRKRKADADGVWTPDNNKKSMAYDVSYQNLIVVVDHEAKGHITVADFVLSRNMAHSTSPRVLLIAPITKKQYNQAEVDTLIQQLGNPPVTYTSTLNINRKSTTYSYQKRAPEQKMVWQGFPELSSRFGGTSEKFSRLCWETKNVSLDDGGFYIDVDRFTAVKDGIPLRRFDELINMAKRLGILADDVDVYGMSQNDKKHIKDNADWVDVYDYIKQQFLDLNQGNVLYNRSILFNIRGQMSVRVRDIFIDHWAQQRPMLSDGPFTEFFDKLADLEKNSVEIDVSAVNDLATILGIRTGVHAQATALYDEWQGVLKQYGMLPLINWNELNFNNLQQVITYINAVTPKP